jgi:hypothetical protein
MLIARATQGQIEVQERAAIGPQAQGGVEIEKIILRARQIHREHGGIFGYDFDDWARAWSEPHGSSHNKSEGAFESIKELAPELKKEVFEPCFGCGS